MLGALPRLLVVLTLVGAGCGGECPPSGGSGRADLGKFDDAASLSSPVVLTIRPAGTFGGGALAGVTSFDAVSTSGKVTLIPMTGAPSSELVTAGTGVILAVPRVIGGKAYLFLGVGDEQEVFHFQSVHDVDGDGILEPETLRTHFTTAPTPAFFTYLAVAGDTWYFLDRRCQDIRCASDTNADGLPDRLHAAPYARSADHPYLLRVKSIGARVTGVLHASTVDLARVSGQEAGWAVYRDADLDGVAETETRHAPGGAAPASGENEGPVPASK